MPTVASTIAAGLANFGLDICVPFPSELYNERVRAAEHPALPSLCGRTLALLVANSRALWPRFVAHLRANPAAVDAANPLDEFVANGIRTVLISALPGNIQTDVRFAFDRGDRFVAFQKLGHTIGESYYNQHQFISSHPAFGPWKAFRAVITIAIDASDLEFDAYAPLDDPFPEGAPEVARSMKLYFDALEAKNSHPQESGPQEVYKFLVMARDASTSPAQRQHRYGEDQIAYHYSKKKEILRRLVLNSIE